MREKHRQGKRRDEQEETENEQCIRVQQICWHEGRRVGLRWERALAALWPGQLHARLEIELLDEGVGCARDASRCVHKFGASRHPREDGCVEAGT